MKQRLIIICGFPGVGKTIIAQSLAKRINAGVVTSEKVVAELYKNTLNAHQDKDWSPEELERGYDELTKRVRQELVRNRTVIAEGSFRYKRQRERVLEIARELHIPHSIIVVTCPDKILKKRLEERFQTTSHQFGYQAHLAVKKVYEPVEHPDFVVNSSSDVEKQLRAISNLLNDGDRVEVDANKGIVQKIKR